MEGRQLLLPGGLPTGPRGRERVRRPVPASPTAATAAVAAVGDAGTGRRTRSLPRGPVGRPPGSRSWRPSIQNVQIGIIETEQARLLDGGPYGPVRIEVVVRIIPGVV